MPSDSDSRSQPFDPLPYRLRIGVAGHRNLTNADEVRVAIQRVLEQIQKTLQPQQRTSLDWVVVSPLALGADRIVAEEILKQAGSSLEVLSPFSLDEYRQDFVEPDDFEEFNRLVSRADSVQCITQTSQPQDGSAEEQSSWRDRGYLNVGRAVVDASEIVVVIWDGEPARGLGGTADTVGYALRQQRTVIWVNSASPLEEPQQILGWEPGRQPDCTRLPITAKQLSPGYHQLDAYNRDARIPRERLERIARVEQNSLRERGQETGLSADNLRHIIDVVVPHFVKSDQLAIHYRKLYVRTMAGLFVLSALAVTIVVGQVLFFPKHLWIILFELLAMGTAVGLWTWCRRGAWHEKWIHDRYLAERLRMTAFSLLLDQSDDTVTPAPGNTLAFYSGPQHWLLLAVRTVVERTRSVPHTTAEFKAVRQFLIEAWLEDQQQYHTRNGSRKHAAAHRGHRTGMVLFLLTLVMALLHFLGVGHDDHHHAATDLQRVDVWITFFAIVLPAWGAAIHAITNQLELERIAARSQRMSALLSIVIERARKAESLEELREVVSEGQRVMGTENHEWWILLSFRQPILPT